MEDILGLGNPDKWLRPVVRLLAAVLLGGIIGIQREHTGKPAGLRTHMLVALAACLFVLVISEMGMTEGDASRVIQGVATGIGFIGGGAILKLRNEHEVHGLTTAAGIWMTASMGVAVGLGQLAAALVSVILAWFILAIVAKVEHRLAARKTDNRLTT
jgi:putative Mg2+ transporter-C (MgtC) family protein